MSVNLQKGQRVDLTKGNAGLSQIMVGLGWDAAKQAGGSGFLGSIFGKPSANIDCDASAIMLNADGKLVRKENLIYFGNLRSGCGSVRHSGDNLTGDGDGDDEQIVIDLPKIPANIAKVVFVVNIYDCVARKQDFGMINNAFIRIVNSANNQELIRYNLSDNYAGKTALIAGEIYRHNNEWKFAAIGEGSNDTSLKQLVQKY